MKLVNVGDYTGPLSLSVISNPLSGANKRGLASVSAIVNRHARHWHYIAATAEECREVIDEIHNQPPQVLAINGGDGSIALIISLLLENPPEPFPLLALVQGGTTNMSAADIGLKGCPDRALARLISYCGKPEPSRLKMRSLLCIQPDDRSPHYGFFWGAGLIARAVALSLEQRAKSRWPSLVPPLLTANLLIALMQGKRPLGDPPAARVEADSELLSERPMQALFATSLHSLLLGIRPVEADSENDLFCWGAVEPGAPKLWRTLPAYLYGREHPFVSAEHGFHRGKVRQLSVDCTGDYMVDGELYPQASTLHLSSGPRLAFVRV